MLAIVLFSTIVGEMLPVTNNSPLIGQSCHYNTRTVMAHLTVCCRNLLQLHHVHGGQLRGHHHHGPQLPPQAGGHPRDARLGEVAVPAVAALATEDVAVR